MKIVIPTSFGDNDFSRASIGTYFDANGVIQTAAAGVPRWTYDPTNLAAAPKLMLEQSATNLELYSNDFTQSVWQKSQCSISSDTKLSPVGTVAQKLVESAGGVVTHYCGSQLIGVTDGVGYTFTRFVAAGGRNWVAFETRDRAGTWRCASFNLASGSWGTVNPALSVSSVYVGNGWYKLKITVPVGSGSAIPYCTVFIANGDGAGSGIAYAGDGVSGIYIACFQALIGLTESSYIPTTSAPVTRAADVMTTGMITNVPENDAAVWQAGSYGVGALVMVGSGYHTVYKSAVANNAANPTTDNGVNWVPQGATNAYKSGDQSIASQTTNPVCIVNQYQLKGRINTVALLNVSAASARVTMTDPTDGVVYDKTINLVSNSGINNLYSYFFELPVRSTDIVLTDLPAYAFAQLTVALNEPTGTAKVGCILIGTSKNTGGTQYGMKMSITDYSIKTQDAFGGYTVSQRAYRKTCECQVLVDATYVDQLQTLLAGRRAQPTLYLGSDQFASSWIYGFYRDFSTVINQPTCGLHSITIEGLT